jgi:hypothetical protein
LGGEVKWSNLTPSNLPGYKAFADCLLDEIDRGPIRYRQMFCDRALVRVAPYGEGAVSDLDVQFKLCYQFIKHSFGLEYLDPAQEHYVLVCLDTHSSQKHKKNLASFARGIPGVLNHPNLTVQVTYHRSEFVNNVQACDLIIGAAGSWGNKMHMLRKPGKRGMTAKQKARAELCKHIYNRLRSIDGMDRGALAFNWFESTGKDGDRSNLLHHKIRIWKFCPQMYRIDKGWENDHLDKQGQYQGPQLESRVRSVDPGDKMFY